MISTGKEFFLLKKIAYNRTAFFLILGNVSD